jgi:hypothetical protein
MSIQIQRGLVFCVVIFVLSGCANMRKPGFPNRFGNEAKELQLLEEQFAKPELVANYYKIEDSAEGERRKARDKIIAGRIALINLQYSRFVSQFSFNKQSIDSTAEITELGLNLATTAVGGAGTKTILGAIAAGVTGAKLAIDKNFFYEKSVPVLVSAMNAQRQTALIPILKGLKLSSAEYPLAQGLSDIDAYYFAGTFIGALQAIQADAGEKQKQAEAVVNSVRFREDTAAKQLRAWLFPSGPEAGPNAEHLAALRKWKKDHGLDPIKIERFLEEELYTKSRQDAVQDLNIPATSTP